MFMTVAFPVLNEEETIESSILHFLEHCRQNQLNDLEVVIADNGSTDKTLSIAKRLSKDNSQVRITSTKTPGVGGGLKKAWCSSTSEFVGYMDLDFATDLKHFTEVYHRLFKTKDQKQLITGSRLLPQSKVIGRKLLRTITSRGFNFLLKILLGVKFHDGMCGFKFLSREIFQEINNKFVTSDQWFFCTEIMVKTCIPRSFTGSVIIGKSTISSLLYFLSNPFTLTYSLMV